MAAPPPPPGAPPPAGNEMRAHAIVCVCVRRLCVPIWQALRDAETAVARASPACSAGASDAGA